MSTLREMAAALARANPGNRPMSLEWMAARWWPSADWVDRKPGGRKNGATTGERVAGAFAGRLQKAGLLREADPKNSDDPARVRYLLSATVGNHKARRETVNSQVRAALRRGRQ